MGYPSSYKNNELKRGRETAVRLANERSRLEHALRMVLNNLKVEGIDDVIVLVKTADFSRVEQVGKPPVKERILWQCNVLNCGDGVSCVHKKLEEECPHCGYPMIENVTNGFKFCSNPDYQNGCDYEVEPGGEHGQDH